MLLKTNYKKSLNDKKRLYYILIKSFYQLKKLYLVQSTGKRQ